MYLHFSRSFLLDNETCFLFWKTGFLKFVWIRHLFLFYFLKKKKS